MAHLDFKVTVWKRIHIPDNRVDEVIEKLKSGVDETPYNLLEDDDFYYNPQGVDEESEEAISVSENGEQSTQEIYNSVGEIIYKNGKERN